MRNEKYTIYPLFVAAWPKFPRLKENRNRGTRWWRQLAEVKIWPFRRCVGCGARSWRWAIPMMMASDLLPLSSRWLRRNQCHFYSCVTASDLENDLWSHVPELMKADNFPPARLYFILVNFLVWRTLQQKIYRRKIRDVDRRCVELLGQIGKRKCWDLTCNLKAD